MNFINCTPHAITVVGLGTLEKSGIIARCSVTRTPCPDIGGIRLTRQVIGPVIDLPAPADDTIYVVSGMVLGELRGTRPDVVGPDTGKDAIRNAEGHVTAVLGFV